MENIGSAINYVSPGDYMVSLDLKDAYFSVPIHPLDRNYYAFFGKAKDLSSPASILGIP